MKKLNFNIKDRKVLYGILVIVVVSVFTLTIAYAALSAVLTISGSAQVNAADWDIYLDNAKVTNGSATTDEPYIITNSTLEFETTLNMPGDFYEFTVDVVNNGSIDAMIENVIKNPELTAAQAKYLKYEVSYQNGESISKKQLLAKGTTMPIKVRIEYRKDLTASDLPTGQVVLDLSLTLEYVQSDGTGSSVTDNGELKLINVVSGDIDTVGSEICIGSECFYVIDSDNDDVYLFAKNNITLTNIPVQSTDAGTINYSSDEYWSDPVESWSYVYNNKSKIFSYIENYKSSLISSGLSISNARLISYEELENLGCYDMDGSCEFSDYDWLYSTNYWTGSTRDWYQILCININSSFSFISYNNSAYGIRPVILIPKSEILGSDTGSIRKEISFCIDPYCYDALEGMTWGEWVNSEYNSSNEWSISDNMVVTIEHGQYDEYELVVFDEDAGGFVGEDDVIVPGRVYTRY